ncbi:MAG: flagellar basal body L-ring protein FlgH [Desulfuromusa sp.]|nr:flagellar basal body L-ring protein FlgH [Desulfuromusa sp.]
MWKNRFWLLSIVVFLSACAVPSSKVDLAEVEPIAPIMTEPSPPQTAGSLWTVSRGGMFVDLKGRTVGDIITVVIVENASASKEATTETDRTSSMSAGITNFFGLEKNLENLNSAIVPSALINATTTNDFEGGGKTARKENLVTTLTTQVIEVLPNGNLKIEGNKTVTVNSEMQIVKLSGIVRSADVSPHNMVDSKNILNARIAYYGDGVISDKQQQGWLVRILDRTWPF